MSENEEYFDFSNTKKETPAANQNDTFAKIAELMCWDAYAGETPQDVFERNGNNLNAVPAKDIIDIVHAGGLLKWAEGLEVNSQAELYQKVMRAIRLTIAEPVFQDKKKIDIFPPFANFFYYCQRLDRNGRTAEEANGVSNVAWNGVICRRNITNRTREMFAHPDPQKFKIAAEKIKEVYKYTDANIEALRYFVCQSRHENHNPSMNKAIYHWGDEKQTGKTTVAKTIIAILNGDILENAGTYESNLNIELQYDKHACPKAALFNSVLLDEAAPKDSRKSYPAVKSKLTNNSCDFDPKYKMVITIPCKRYYYFTSNDPIYDFVQDHKERRFLEIHSTEKPVQMSFEDIYKLWFDFCTNATPEENWQVWYNSFAFIEGLATKDVDEIVNEIFLRWESVFSTVTGTYTTAKQVADKLFKNEPTPEQKRGVRTAMEKLFSECKSASNKSFFNIMSCRAKIIEMSRDIDMDVKDDGFPF